MPQSVTVFQWNDSYRLGLTELDEQHRTFFELTNGFWNAVVAGEAGAGDTQRVLAELSAYPQTHFRDEESFMARLDFPREELDRHLAAHDSFTTRLNALLERFRDGDRDTAREIVAFMSGWLVRHILEVDVRYAQFHKNRPANQATVVLGNAAAHPPVPGRATATPAFSLDEIGPYRILGQIGKGGMGTVYKALHTALGRLVAIKVLTSELALDEERVARFLREAKLVASLSHPNVVGVYDAGEVGGRYYIAMELVDGPSLASYIEDKGVLDEAETLEFLRQAAAGLDAAHSKGLVHRDIKPENLLLERDRTLRIVDFGIAMDVQGVSSLTAPGVLIGTPQYMSPEQSDGQKLDARSDLYSLGVSFYEALTGAVPLQATSLISQLVMNKQEKPEPPKSRRPELSDSMNNLLLRLLCKRREDRMPSARALVETIDRLRAGEPIAAPPADY
jgi:hemerythrin-like metal-binding protein